MFVYTGQKRYNIKCHLKKRNKMPMNFFRMNFFSCYSSLQRINYVQKLFEVCQAVTALPEDCKERLQRYPLLSSQRPSVLWHAELRCLPLLQAFERIKNTTYSSSYMNTCLDKWHVIRIKLGLTFIYLSICLLVYSALTVRWFGKTGKVLSK